MSSIRALADSVPEPGLQFMRLIIECGWACLQGDLPTAEQWAIQAFEVGTASGQPDALMAFGGMLSTVRYHQGRSGELVEQILQLIDEPNSLDAWRATAANALLESGRVDEARELALAEDLQGIPWDMFWLLAMFQWADVYSRLGLADRMRELYELLVPYSRQCPVISSLVYGSVDWTLGTLATALGRYEQAESHFAEAAELEERLGAPVLLARTRAGCARALIARGHPEDLERAQHMLEQADEVAGRLGAQGVTREVAECRSALAAISG